MYIRENALFHNFLKIYLVIWLHWVFIVACGIDFPNWGWNQAPIESLQS